MPRESSHALRETYVPLTLMAGDALVTFGGLALGWWLRYRSPLGRLGIDVPNASFARYLPLLLVGVALLVAAFTQLGLYDSRLILRRYQSLNAILKGAAFWLVAYLGISLVLKFEPPISRLFVLVAFVCTIALLYFWRTLAYNFIAHGTLLACLRRRTVLIGWNDDARALAADIARDPAHPLMLVGVVTLGGDTTAPFAPSPSSPGERHLLDDIPRGDASGECNLIGYKPVGDGLSAPETEPQSATPSPASVPNSKLETQNSNPSLPAAIQRLGGVAELDAILARESVDMLILTRLDLPRDRMNRIMESCERFYVEWKVVAGAFDIFAGGLRLQTIGRIPVLGVEELAVNRLFNRALKRAFDLLAAGLGLILSAPLLLVLALAIKRESPGGPVLFRQTRVGANHRNFTLLKLRSMIPDAAATDDAAQSTVRGDPRLLRIGEFMRRWNLDELPQFWNILRGDMSLVGPRPERPFHVEQLADTIPHYLPRHLVKPGLTGWAQINGLRGETDLAARVQHDIYYIENWSVWLDAQIVLLTLARWHRPHA